MLKIVMKLKKKVLQKKRPLYGVTSLEGFDKGGGVKGEIGGGKGNF